VEYGGGGVHIEEGKSGKRVKTSARVEENESETPLYVAGDDGINGMSREKKIEAHSDEKTGGKGLKKEKKRREDSSKSARKA